MIIPFPERIPIVYAATFGMLLCLLLVLSGTGAVFAALAFVFIVLATLAFNIAGGLTRPSGSYVFFFAILVIILGLVVKVVIWEPADLFLRSPITTVGAYTGGMAGMLAAVYVSRRFSRKEGFLQDICSVDTLGLAAMGCVVGGFGLPFVLGLLASTGSALFIPLATALSQFNRFLEMGVILGTTYEIKKSGGKRSFNSAVILGWILSWYVGVFIGFGKEALFTPPLCWLVSCAVLRYRFALYQMVGLGLLLLFCTYYLVPYCQYGRGPAGELHTTGEHIGYSYELITHLGEVREKYLLSQEGFEARESGWPFFKRDEGLFNRLQMMSVDDALITVTDAKGTYGMGIYFLYASSVVPRFLWANKPLLRVGNEFSHEIGFDESDTTTGISFSPVSEAYHEAKWFAVLVVEPLLWTPMFIMMDSLCGDLRKSPWGILVLALFAHIAPEGGVGGVFYMMTYGTLIVLFVAYFSAYVMPWLSSLVAPPKRTVISAGGAPGGRGAAFANARPAPLKR